MTDAGLKKSVLIMAGGTGGHVFPGLAAASALDEKSVSVTWLGTRRGVEARLVPAAGIPISYINVSGVRGKGLVEMLKAPFQVIAAIWQAGRILRRVRPNCVLGLGGFAAGPGGIASWLLRKPLVIHEQNAVAGTTNRLLARFARRILLGFPGAFPDNPRVIHTGNPVRRDIAALVEPGQRLAEHGETLRLLVVGGSLGASILNETLPGTVAGLGNIDVWHQTGTNQLQQVRDAYQGSGIEARVEPFIDDMAEAYHWADLVVCRSGALTVSELAAAGLASILIPFPAAIDDHQTRNALWLVEAGAACLVPQSELGVEKLRAQISGLVMDREALLTMSKKARALAMPDADRKVAEICLEVANG
jgi:UDP-N-acetylglucosamine--N-acetylmuramyl-(pentapeptide) pyrophosphoryl-undecaprenol N-acetylglucosamine transferase